MAGTATEHNRLAWRSRRGLLELDLLLPPFIHARWPQLSPEEIENYTRLLACEDQDIWDWVRRIQSPPDEGLQQVVDLIVRFNADRDARAGAHTVD